MKGHKALKGTHIHHFSIWDKSKKKKSRARDRIRVKLIMRTDKREHPEIPRHLAFAERHTMFSDHTGVNDQHLEVIRRFAKTYNLNIDNINVGLGVVNLSGTTAAMEKAFKVELYSHSFDRERKLQTHEVIGHTGEASIPRELEGIVRSILGLNNTLVFHQVPYMPMETTIPAVSIASGMSSAGFAKRYNFPIDANGSGQQIAIIACGGGFNRAEFRKYFKLIGLDKPPEIKTVSVDGSEYTPGENKLADYELYTDCLVAATAAPGALIKVYFVRNDIMGFADAVEMIAKEGEKSPHIISYSWGASETTYSENTIAGVNQILQYATQVNQCTILCSSGDFGSTNAMQNTAETPLAVQFPASSPWVTSCGGTMLSDNTDVSEKEVVWNSIFLYDMLISNASGGGFSVTNKRPDYQKDVIHADGYPQKYRNARGVPDVAGHASIKPNSVSYWIYLHNENWLTGGTSAVAPLWAALVARLNQALGRRIGFMNPLLYAMAGTDALKDIKEGSNAMPGGPPQWQAQSGWDPCTGLGVPHGENMLKWLKKNLK